MFTRIYESAVMLLNPQLMSQLAYVGTAHSARRMKAYSGISGNIYVEYFRESHDVSDETMLANTQLHLVYYLYKASTQYSSNKS